MNGKTKTCRVVHHSEFITHHWFEEVQPMSDTALKTINGSAKPAPTADSPALTLTPRVDILETEDELLVLADMPGVRPEDVDVRFENGELTVHGRRESAHKDKPRAFSEAEVNGYFRSFRLTEHLSADKIEAELKNGVLTLRLPKVEAVKPRRIAVKG
jgi:HSP20 family protein